MKRYLSIAVILLLASIAASIAGPDTAALEAKETAAWQAFKDKKADDFKKVVDKDMVDVSAEGIADMNKDVEDMQKWDMKSFAISNYKVFSDEKDVAVSTYTVAVQGTYNGQDASGTYNSGSVWKM